LLRPYDGQTSHDDRAHAGGKTEANETCHRMRHA
jgi:hypothetical protein